MEGLSDFAIEIVEFPAYRSETLGIEHEEISTGTGPLPKLVEKSVETNRKLNAETQTEAPILHKADFDEKKLANWLKRVCPMVESELLKGMTPLPENYGFDLDDVDVKDIEIQIYQKISFPFKENFHGLATWLSICTNNTPALALATSVSHDSWCEHVDQIVKVFTPRRIQSSTFVVFQELKSMPTKGCLSNLSTNPFDKNIFAGSTVSGDLYIWKFILNKAQGDVKELLCQSLEHGNVVSIDWPSTDRLLTCHANGLVCLWIIGKQLFKENEFSIKNKNKEMVILSILASISPTEFVVGCSNGDLYHCTGRNIGSVRNEIELARMKGHQFSVSSLFKKKIAGKPLVISCDLSGEVFFHDMANQEEDGPEIISKIPLPFQSNITCSKNGKILFCPGVDGALEIYRISSGTQTTVKGVLQGRGNMIRLSDNDHWIVTGLYGGDFQIYKLWD